MLLCVGGTPPDDFPFYDVLHNLWSEKDVFNDELLDDSMTNDNFNGILIIIS